jgi:hypothetical protein
MGMKPSKQTEVRRNRCVADREVTVNSYDWGIILDELDRQMVELWKAKSPQERTLALELLHQFKDGRQTDQVHLQRVFETVKQLRDD